MCYCGEILDSGKKASESTRCGTGCDIRPQRSAYCLGVTELARVLGRKSPDASDSRLLGLASVENSGCHFWSLVCTSFLITCSEGNYYRTIGCGSHCNREYSIGSARAYIIWRALPGETRTPGIQQLPGRMKHPSRVLSLA